MRVDFHSMWSYCKYGSIALLLSFVCFTDSTQPLYAETPTGVAGDTIQVVHNLFLPLIVSNSPPHVDPIPFSGGALYRAEIGEDHWYLHTDGSVTLGPDGSEPFPLDPELGAESLAAKGNALYVLADDGIYKRPATGEAWQQMNNLEGRFLSAGASELWFTSIDTPSEVWVSTDEINWESRSVGLSGQIISPVLVSSTVDAGYFVVTQDGEYDVLWRANGSGSSLQWQVVALVPGFAIEANRGLFARVVDASTPLGVGVMLGGGDGKLYEYRFYNSTAPTSTITSTQRVPLSDTVNDGWVAVWDFGAENYALPLTGNSDFEIAVINRATGQITIYESVVIEAGNVPKREWHEIPFP